MDFIGTRILLAFDEPWDSVKVVKGRIIQSFNLDGTINFLVEDCQNSELYIIAPRYVSEQITGIFTENQVIVGIYRVDNANLLSKEKELFNHLSYKGVGSVILFSKKEQ